MEVLPEKSDAPTLRTLPASDQATGPPLRVALRASRSIDPGTLSTCTWRDAQCLTNSTRPVPAHPTSELGKQAGDWLQEIELMGRRAAWRPLRAGLSGCLSPDPPLRERAGRRAKVKSDVDDGPDLHSATIRERRDTSVFQARHEAPRATRRTRRTVRPTLPVAAQMQSAVAHQRRRLERDEASWGGKRARARRDNEGEGEADLPTGSGRRRRSR